MDTASSSLVIVHLSILYTHAPRRYARSRDNASLMGPALHWSAVPCRRGQHMVECYCTVRRGVSLCQVVYPALEGHMRRAALRISLLIVVIGVIGLGTGRYQAQAHGA